METNTAVAALQALAQDTRLTAFRLLVEVGPDGMAAGEIAAALGVTPPTLSFHLAALTQAGLVSSRRRGRQVIYAAEFQAMDGLLAFLVDKCCRGEGGCLPSWERRQAPRPRCGNAIHQPPGSVR